MKRKHILMTFLAIALPLFVFGQGCFLIGPPGSGGGAGVIRGDLRVNWGFGAVGSCGVADQVEITITDVNDEVADRARVNCEAQTALFRDLPEGLYNILAVGIDPVGEVVFRGVRTVTVRADGVTTIGLDLIPQ